MEPTEGCRLDALLVQRGLASGREKAKELLAAGAVTVNGRPVTKAAARVRPGDTVACSAAPPPYVGRGGYKLEKALDGRFSPLNFCTKDMVQEEVERLKK